MRSAFVAGVCLVLIAGSGAWGAMPRSENPYQLIADAGRSREEMAQRERGERERERGESKERAEKRERAELRENRERAERERARTPEFFDPDLLHFVTREMPFAAEEIEQLMASREAEAREELEHWREYLREMIELRAENPELYELEKRLLVLDRDAERLGGRIADMPKGKDREKAMLELREVLNQAFEVKEKMRKRDIEMLESELQEQKQMLEKRKKNREEIIERRRQELTGEADVLDW